MIKLARSGALFLSVATLLLVWGGQATAQDKTFVSIATIPGESTDSNHTGWIDAYALDTGATNATGGGGGVTTFADVAFLKGTDKATPSLHDAIAVGTILPTVIIEVCRAGTSPQQCYYRVELNNVSLSGLSLSGSSCVGSGACTPTQTESVSLRYTKIKWIYTPWVGGSPGTQVIKCWDIAGHVRC